MVVAIFLVLLFIAVISFVFAFIFFIFLPAVESQGIPFSYPLFSENEIAPNILIRSETEDKKKNFKAFILCSKEKDYKKIRFDYKGEKSCTLFSSSFDSIYDCKYACIGFGDCVKVCSRGAIKIENNCAVVNNFCNGCGKCLKTCPKNIIQIISRSKLSVLCNADSDDIDIHCAFYKKEINCEYKSIKNPEFWEKFYKTVKDLNFIK